MPQIKPTRGIQLNKAHRLSRGLVGCWFFNEDSGTIVSDLSGNGNHGTLNGSISWVAGKFGSVLYFPNGQTDYVSFVDKSSLNITGNLTISIWVYPTAAGSYPCMISRKYTEEYALFFEAATLKPRLYISGTGVSTTSAVLLNVWTHLAITHDGTNAKFYINGVLDSTQGLVGRPNGNANVLNIGRDPSVTGYKHTGYLDVPSIYNRVLSTSEIDLLYREPFCFMEPMFDWTLYGAISAPPGVGQFIFINQ